MAFQKNFTVKNGLEVNDNLIFADKNQNTVGIGTTITPEKVQVNGGIGATSIVLTGVGTIPTLKSTNALVSNLYGVSGVVTSVSGTDLTYTTGNFGIVNTDNVNAVSGVVTNLSGTISTYTNSYSSVLNSGTVLTPNLYAVSGVVTSISGSSLNYTNIEGSVLNVTGIATVGSISVGSTQVISSDFELQNVVSLDATTTATIEAAIANAPNTFTDLEVTGITTLGTVLVNSGIVTATSGIVTYYGDGSYLNLSGNAATGIGIGTTGGIVGYGITFLDLQGAGVSTTFYDSSVGIATIFFEGGGGGGGAIGIGSTFPGTPLSVELPPSNGDLFFHIDYGRTFIYYDEVILGVGSSAFWIDSSPFNIGIITAIYGGVAFSDGSAGSPSWYFEDDVTTGVFSPLNGELTFVSTGSSVLNINSSGVVVTGVTTSTAVRVGSSTTFSEDLIVNGDARVTGILTVGTSSIILDGNTNIITVGSGVTINGSNGNAVFAGSVTASSFSGDGSGLTGAGSTVADDTTTNSTFYPIFTETTTGTITASKVSTTKLTFNPSTGTLTATDLNSSSDASLKENIETIENAVDTVNDLRGVKFDWKEDGRTSYGVIAQELENVLPELVSNGEVKTVNYNGIIGVLIEAVKELSVEVEDLKNKLS